MTLYVGLDLSGLDMQYQGIYNPIEEEKLADGEQRGKKSRMYVI